MTDIQCLQLMFFIDGDDLEQDVYERLRKDAAKCSRRFSAEIRHTAPFLALVFLAQNGTQDELRQFLSLMHNNGKILELKQARYIIPYVSLLRKREAVLMLGEYLRQRGDVIRFVENEEAYIKSNKKDEDEEEDYDEDKLDEWEDRYSGHSYLAANALQLMIQDFPQVSLFRYLSKDREICLAWLNSHIQSYKFKPKTDWRSNDGMVSRMRYMIFEDESLEK